jgi:hypothetical protein
MGDGAGRDGWDIRPCCGWPHCASALDAAATIVAAATAEAMMNLLTMTSSSLLNGNGRFNEGRMRRARFLNNPRGCERRRVGL